MPELKSAVVKKIQKSTAMDIMKFGGQAVGEERIKNFRAEPTTDGALAIVHHFTNSYADLCGIPFDEFVGALAEYSPKGKKKAAKAEAKPAKKATKEAAKPAKKVAKSVKEEPKKKKKK